MENSPIVIILNLAAAAALLIWAVRLVRTSFERAFSSQMRQWLKLTTGNRLTAAMTGVGISVMLQSSTAVALLLASFMPASAMSVSMGLAIILGADLGSAIVVQILSSRISLLTPLLLLSGVFFFMRTNRKVLRQIGRILIGLSLIFVSLGMISEASAPLANNAAIKNIFIYLSDDLLTGFVLAAFLAWMMHSSIAAVLLFATLAANGVLPLNAAFAMTLGANLGGSFIAVFLTLKSDINIRKVVLANLLLRGGGALVALGLIHEFDIINHIFGATSQLKVLNFHLFFNAAVLLAGIILLTPASGFVAILLPEKQDTEELSMRSVLDLSVQNEPARAFACVRRELVDMGNRIENMLRDAMDLFENYDENIAERLRAEERNIAKNAFNLRVYLSGIRSDDPSEDTGTRAFDFAGIATNLESGADAIGRKIVTLAKRMHHDRTHFSEDGRHELMDFYDKVLRNIQQGILVLMNEDVETARELVAQKEMIRELNQKQGLTETIETSAIHIDLLRSLKVLNTGFAMIAYPLLREHGALLKSRLSKDSLNSM
ncbi:MAG: Na/Pi cotransporter family protein [Alphaproteobacteria bacterium]|nr:Na/Pi cotransporter family protein [Alphaproteobacteria bacterium]